MFGGKKYQEKRWKYTNKGKSMEIVKTLPTTDEQTFTEALTAWYNTWKDFLNEKTTNLDTGRWCYTHKRVRSEYRSLKTNLPYLFTYQQFPELLTPNTTNSLDGFFNRLKSLLNVHRGLNTKRQKRIVIEILKGKF